MKKVFLQYFKSTSIIIIAITSITAVLAFLFGEAAFSPLIKIIAGQILSVKDITLFLVYLTLSCFVLEYFLRHQIQRRLQSSKIQRMIGFTVPIVIYSAVGAYFGTAVFIYYLLNSSFLSYYYMRQRCWKSIALGHITWLYIFIPASMAFCVFVDGQIRRDFLFSYKKRHIIKEKMYYLEDWGWVDKIHYRPDHYEIVSKALLTSKESGRISLGDSWVTPLKIHVSFSVDYSFQKSSDPLKNWAIICGIMMDFMRVNEQVQETSPWYHGNQLSAWQFDDMSSCLLCCLDRLPSAHKLPRGKEISKKEKLLLLWNKMGEQLVTQKVKENESWALLNRDEEEMLRSIIRTMKKSWLRQQIVRSTN
ncbi:MAG: hypothetical protein HRT88_21485 [Lentisphaeraceae bacterium]|nr:hypothetical protein [Lentisphaeraceae bacterium]